MFSFKSKKDNSTSFLGRLKSGLGKTREKIGSGLSSLFLGKKQIDESVFETLETALLTADVGVTTTNYLLNQIREKITRNNLNNPDELLTQLKAEMLMLLQPCEKALTLTASPFVLLMVGVNGAGKTTSTAKITHLFQAQGKKVLLAAGDTFRAAAIEQLQSWGKRNQVSVVATQQGADSASVVYDAIQSAKARHVDLLIADTAGRLHTQNHLMAEIEKVKRVITKQIPEAPHETLLVIDAGTGQNALTQAREFNQCLTLSGICLTKLDGSAKGGVILAIAHEFKLPIRYIGIGESINDLQPFNAQEFIDALFD